jgi:phosphoserine phosphatase RsbU/P
MLGAKGIALGVMEDINLQEIELDLTDNDTLVFYTDGVTEAINGREEQFGMERLSRLITQNNTLNARDLINLIKSSIIDFTQGQAQFDDITLMVLKTNQARI